MVEVHNSPEQALSDGPQSLTFEEFGKLMQELHVICQAMKMLKASNLEREECLSSSLNFGEYRQLFAEIPSERTIEPCGTTA
jgi:hypothetical protein